MFGSAADWAMAAVKDSVSSLSLSLALAIELVYHEIDRFFSGKHISFFGPMFEVDC